MSWLVPFGFILFLSLLVENVAVPTRYGLCEKDVVCIQYVLTPHLPRVTSTHRIPRRSLREYRFGLTLPALWHKLGVT